MILRNPGKQGRANPLMRERTNKKVEKRTSGNIHTYNYGILLAETGYREQKA